jgi:hypothetical protein
VYNAVHKTSGNITDKISEINVPLLHPEHAGQDLKRKKKKAEKERRIGEKSRSDRKKKQGKRRRRKRNGI